MNATTHAMTEAHTQRAKHSWVEYQRQHDVASRQGQTAGIDPASGRLWFGASAQEIMAQREAEGVVTPLSFVRVGVDSYLRFAHKGISTVFRHGACAGKTIDEVAAELQTGTVAPDQWPIQVIERGGVLSPLNNRSLMALRLAGMAPTSLSNGTGNPAFEALLTQRLTEHIPLPRPTNATVKGPTGQFEPPTLLVAYDDERDDGVMAWTRFVFNDVLAYAYRHMACCAAEHIIGSQALQRFRASTWLAGLLTVWQEAVGWQQWQQQQGGVQRFQHFRVFFDDAGCVEVIAHSCNIEEE